MQLAGNDIGRGDAAGLAMTLIRTFGSGALALVEAQITACADHSDVQAKWCEARDALAMLADANMHMSAALDLLDQVEETSVPPMLNQAIVQLGLRDGGDRADSADKTIATCCRNFYEDSARCHLAQAQSCDDVGVKEKHLNAASYYATLRQNIIDAST